MDDDDAIAVVGIGGKFPGADNTKEFWEVLKNGENHVKEIPPDRWNLDAFYSSDPDSVGKTYVHRAGFLKNHKAFDNKLFSISDTEAERMDPQQRYVLECVHMALEDGGITRNMINGSNTGVFIGFMNSDYKETCSDDLTAINNYTLTGSSSSILSARVSYVYNLLGPSMAIDTACSSALVAVDVAIQSLKTGRCPIAICGGVSSILSPDLFVALSRARMVSPTGQCQAFSENADGYARGEGCGIVILKRLADAKRDSNKIWATIATDCNQDGSTASPITAPSSSQQESLLRKVYSNHNVNPQDVQVIEAHGTGTPVGDPIEANTLGNFFGHNNQQQVYIASVKTNIGHLESAAGAAGLIKVLLMMKHQTIVPSLHFKKSNKMIDFEKYQFIVPTQTIPWKSGNLDARLACANSFGFGGTNSHVIIKEYVGKEDTIVEERRANQPYLVFLSASDHQGTKLAIQSFVDQLNDTSPSLKDISYTSLCRRDHFNYRVAFYAENINDLKVKIRNREKSPEQIIKAKLTPPKVVAVFCGVGTTWRGMCKQLLTTNTVVQDVIRKIDSILSKWLDWSIYDILISSKDVSSPMIAHVSIFTCQVALWTLWRHFGLNVDAVIGQSVGEVAAAYAVDSLTLEQAVEIIYHRSQILANITGGKMFVIGNCQVDYIESVCSQFQGKACIAVYNSSTSCTVSCDFGVIGDVKAAIRNGLPSEHRATFFEKDLDVQCAYHSHHTEQAGNNLQQALGNLKSKSPSLPFFSTVSGTEVKDDCILGPIYWNKNVAKPVLFKQAVTSAGRKQTFNIFLEIGPKPVLRTHLKDSYTEEEAISLPSMKEKNEVNTFSDTLCKCFESGLNLNWNVVSKENGKLCDLPKYSFNPAQKGLFQSDKTLLKRQGLENIWEVICLWKGHQMQRQLSG